MVRVEHRDRLVGEQHRGFDGQCARQQHACAFADREPAHAARRELERVRLRASRRSTAASSAALSLGAVRAVRQPAERDELARGERPVHGRILRQVRDGARARPAVEARERRAAPRHGRRGARRGLRARAAACSCRRRWVRRARRARLARARASSAARPRALVADLDVRRRRASWRRHASAGRAAHHEMQEERRAEQRRHDAELELRAPAAAAESRRRRVSRAARRPRKLGSSRRLGCWPTARRSKCGTTRPTKPTTPVTATAPPTASAVPPMTSACVRLRVEPEARGRVLAERQRIEAASRRRDEQPARHHQRQREIHVREAAVGERPEHPEQDLERRVRARCEVQRERGQRRGQRVDRDAREHDREEIAAPARERVQRGEREQRAARPRRAAAAATTAPASRSRT